MLLLVTWLVGWLFCGIVFVCLLLLLLPVVVVVAAFLISFLVRFSAWKGFYGFLGFRV